MKFWVFNLEENCIRNFFGNSVIIDNVPIKIRIRKFDT